MTASLIDWNTAPRSTLTKTRREPPPEAPMMKACVQPRVQARHRLVGGVAESAGLGDGAGDVVQPGADEVGIPARGVSRGSQRHAQARGSGRDPRSERSAGDGCHVFPLGA